MGVARSARIVKILVRSGAEVDAVDGNQCTPLHLAAFRGDFGVVKALLDAGADLSCVDSCDETPLEMAEEKLLQSRLLTKMDNLKEIIELLKRSKNVPV